MNHLAQLSHFVVLGRKVTCDWTSWPNLVWQSKFHCMCNRCSTGCSWDIELWPNLVWALHVFNLAAHLWPCAAFRKAPGHFSFFASPLTTWVCYSCSVNELCLNSVHSHCIGTVQNKIPLHHPVEGSHFRAELLLIIDSDRHRHTAAITRQWHHKHKEN